MVNDHTVREQVRQLMIPIVTPLIVVLVTMAIEFVLILFLPYGQVATFNWKLLVLLNAGDMIIFVIWLLLRRVLVGHRKADEIVSGVECDLLVREGELLYERELAEELAYFRVLELLDRESNQLDDKLQHILNRALNHLARVFYKALQEAKRRAGVYGTDSEEYVLANEGVAEARRRHGIILDRLMARYHIVDRKLRHDYPLDIQKAEEKRRHEAA